MLIVKCLWWLQFMYFLNANEPPRRPIIYWESFQPGQLLHSLIQLTADIDLQPFQHNVSTNMASAQQRMDNVAEASSNYYDYDRAYDDFVRKYFSDAVNSAFYPENSGSVEEIEEDALSEASRTSQRKKQQQQQCKQVRKNRDICKICRNKNTGEKSETCSYASETAPREYAYEKARKYQKTRQSSVEVADDSKESTEKEDYDDEQYDDELESATTRKESGSCTRLQKHDKVCYFCINSAGEKIKECTKLTNTSKRRTADKNDKLKKSQRIYKRKVSFVHEHKNNTVGNTDKSGLTVQHNAEKVTEGPTLRKKVVIKVIKRKKTMK